MPPVWPESHPDFYFKVDIEIDVSCKNTDALQHNSVTEQDTEGGMDLLSFAEPIRKI